MFLSLFMNFSKYCNNSKVASCKFYHQTSLKMHVKQYVNTPTSVFSNEYKMGLRNI